MASASGTELPDSAANPKGMKAQGKPPHSVFTGDLIDAEGRPTRAAVDEVINFFREVCRKRTRLRDGVGFGLRNEAVHFLHVRERDDSRASQFRCSPYFSRAEIL